MIVDIFETRIEIDETLVADSPATIRKQICEYERGDRQSFDLQVTVPDGVTGDVMTVMAEIPHGQTRTYGEIAVDLDTSPIAVGRACAANPVPLVIPCHRVVGSDGGLRGYSAADGVATKRQLLDLEARNAGTGPVQTRLPTRE